jgi:hypothetical protein
VAHSDTYWNSRDIELSPVFNILWEKTLAASDRNAAVVVHGYD